MLMMMMLLDWMLKIVNHFPTLEHEYFLTQSYDVTVQIPVFGLWLKMMTLMVVVVVVVAVSTWIFFYLTWLVNRNVSASMCVCLYLLVMLFEQSFSLWTETGTTEQDQAIFFFFFFSLLLSSFFSLSLSSLLRLRLLLFVTTSSCSKRLTRSVSPIIVNLIKANCILHACVHMLKLNIRSVLFFLQLTNQ